MYQRKYDNLPAQHVSGEYSMASDAYSIKKPFLEQDILCLQDMFLTNGFHAIEVADIEVGRLIMQTFLQAASLYHNVACVTNQKYNSLPEHVTNIRMLLCDIYLFNALHNLDDFFYNQFYFDFLWIELTPDLVTTGWFSLFKKKLIDLQIDKNISIVTICYENGK